MQKLHPDSNQETGDTTKLAQIVSEAKETILKNDFNQKVFFSSRLKLFQKKGIDFKIKD